MLIARSALAGSIAPVPRCTSLWLQEIVCGVRGSGIQYYLVAFQGLLEEMSDIDASGEPSSNLGLVFAIFERNRLFPTTAAAFVGSSFIGCYSS